VLNCLKDNHKENDHYFLLIRFDPLLSLRDRVDLLPCVYKIFLLSRKNTQ